MTFACPWCGGAQEYSRWSGTWICSWCSKVYGETYCETCDKHIDNCECAEAEE